jgi:hypothetical protein
MARNHLFRQNRSRINAWLIGARQQPGANDVLQRRQRVMTIQHDIKTSQNDLRTISTLVADAMGQFAKLFQNEIDLAKAELSDRAQKITGAAGLLAGGALLVIPALVMALLALSAALISAGWSQPLSYLTSAIVAGAIAGMLFAVGINRLDARNLAPRETIRQLEKDKDTVKGMVR